MAYTPASWVENQINMFDTSPVLIMDMLDAMRGSMVPDWWIDEALHCAENKLN